MRNKGVKSFIKRFKFAWQYASAGRFAFYPRRNSGITQLQLLELYLCQRRGESGVMMFPNGCIRTEKAHQNELERLGVKNAKK